MAKHEGRGWSSAALDDLGDHYGFRKVRTGLGVEAFGVNAICMPSGMQTGFHFHDEQEELYVVLDGEITMRFGDGEEVVLGRHDAVRVDADVHRQVTNTGDGDALYLVVGGKGGYVGRDGRMPEGEQRFSGS